MTAKPLLMLHGFAGSPRSWDAVLADAQLGRRPVTPHLPGHGDAPTIAGGFDAVVDHLAAALDPEPHGVVGYSLGARLALGLAVRHPRRVERLLLVGVNPGLDDEGFRKRYFPAQGRVGTCRIKLAQTIPG